MNSLMGTRHTGLKATYVAKNMQFVGAALNEVEQLTNWIAEAGGMDSLTEEGTVAWNCYDELCSSLDVMPSLLSEICNEAVRVILPNFDY